MEHPRHVDILRNADILHAALGVRYREIKYPNHLMYYRSNNIQLHTN